MTDKPKFEDAPGLVIRPAGKVWEGRWQCRTDLLERGFKPKSRRVWTGLEPTELERAYVSDQCNRLQDEMLIFGRGGLPETSAFDGTLNSLIKVYQTDPDSGFHKLRYQIRNNYAQILRRLGEQHGDEKIADIKARGVLAWHKAWSDDGKRIAMAKMFVGMLRTVIGFGATFLEDEQCIRVKAVLSGMRFKMPNPRTEFLTYDQVVAICAEAHRFGYHSIALAQAFQFECTLRQKDILGELVPLSEPGVSDVTWGGYKWLHGLRWSEIDQNMILRHVTSKTGKEVEINLHNAPLVLEQLALLREREGPLPTSGPIVRSEMNGRPWVAAEFRRKWRLCAKSAGVPDSVKNMDSRAGAITEATSSGAPLEHVQHAATHSDIGMTQRYSRGAADKVANVMQFRTAHRAKRTDD